MKRLLAVVLTLALILTTVFTMPVAASAATEANCSKVVYNVDTWAELWEAVNDNEHNRTIILDKDITIGYNDGQYDYSQRYELKVTGNKTMVLDLNGHLLAGKSKISDAFIEVKDSASVYFISSAAKKGTIRMDIHGGDSNLATIGPAAVKLNTTGTFDSWNVDYEFGTNDKNIFGGTLYIDKNKPCMAIYVYKAKDVTISKATIQNLYKNGKGIAFGATGVSDNDIIIEKSSIKAGGDGINIGGSEKLEIYDTDIRSLTAKYAVNDSKALSSATMRNLVGHNCMAPSDAVNPYYYNLNDGRKYPAKTTDIISGYAWIAFDAANIEYQQTYSEVSKLVIPQGHLARWYETDGIEGISVHTIVTDKDGSTACKFCDYGTKVLKNGWYQDKDGVWYYYTNYEKAVGWKKISKKWYYFNKFGEMQTGLKNIDGSKYFFNNSGAMLTGWQEVNGDWYYFKSGGAAAKGWLQTAGQKTKSKSDDKWYYFDLECKMKTGLLTISGSKYYFNDSGKMMTGWQKVDGAWYYFNSGGVAAKGWTKISSVWYYFGTDNKMVTGLQTIDGSKYFFKSGGAMATGWQEVDGDWYYFKSGGAAAEGWLKIGKVWYYFDDECKMVSGAGVVIDGEVHDFKDSGAWIKQIS